MLFFEGLVKSIEKLKTLLVIVSFYWLNTPGCGILGVVSDFGENLLGVEIVPNWFKDAYMP